MRVFGLIGFPLGHSFSESYFAEKFARLGLSDCTYRNFPLEALCEFPQLLEQNHDIVGLNVTIPYKKQILKYLGAIDPVAAEIGAVNTITVTREEGKTETTGYNTDTYGFHETLKPLLKDIHTHALVLGTGGSSKAVAHALRTLGIKVSYVSRKPNSAIDYAYTDLNPKVINQNLVIINTSPVGMYPNVGEWPDIPYELLGSDHILYDLIYNPAETEFLKKGKKQGASVKNGLEMLHLQAEKAWEIWNR